MEQRGMRLASRASSITGKVLRGSHVCAPFHPLRCLLIICSQFLLDIRARTLKISSRDLPTFLYRENATYDARRQHKGLFQGKALVWVSNARLYAASYNTMV
jgi:hypothetical protein